MIEDHPATQVKGDRIRKRAENPLGKPDMSVYANSFTGAIEKEIHGETGDLPRKRDHDNQKSYTALSESSGNQEGARKIRKSPSTEMSVKI